MLKRKRPDGRPPAKGSNGANKSHNHNKSPPSVAAAAAKPQPEKAVSAFEASYTDVLRMLKKARGFERQRLVRRIAEEKTQSKTGKKSKGKKAKKSAADNVDGDGDGDTDQRSERLQRLEREVEVLKTLDYEVTARVHLANAMLRTRGLAEAPGPLGAHLQLASEVLSQRTKAYRTDDIHNVTSALYNRPFVRDAVAKAVAGMCQLLGLPPPEKNVSRVRKQRKEEDEEEDEEEEKDSVDDDTRRHTQANTPKDKTIAWRSESSEDEEADDDNDEDTEDNMEYNEADDKAIERELAKFESRLGSDEDDDEDESDENDSEDDGLGSGSDDDSDGDLDDDAVVAKLRAKYAAAVAKGLWQDDDKDRDDFSGEDSDGADFEEEQDDEQGEGGDEEEEFGGFSDDGEVDDESESESDEDLRPRKRKATSATTFDGTSHFLPSLMGGYVSDGGDDADGVADDEEAAARMLGGPRKNRRGQRARQAIWEKKYKQLAKHVLEQEKKGTDAGGKDGGKDKKANKNGKQKDGGGGWDAKRGAVDASDKPRWLRRKMGLLGRVGPVGGGGKGAGSNATPPAGAKKENPNANAQVSGTLHPSWEAARKAKDKAQTAAFEGKKIVFD
ncbi:uncharacterized protein SPSK_02364 [Sporothrix schenckii 1099-18]|uniref:Bud22 domain-containing protein n=1 Tax=Sporothrix schenckii 1099-18 TaxID=1397361 RepID=A0A0F2MBX5_SPOSC|nr:uncharacterized protein SPSK_02364 [Sporothrix schenckii 1099-18]KJR86340.1 hypothetical protein SPSK_02364 [Sporothrix schenckii 1099-18]